MRRLVNARAMPGPRAGEGFTLVELLVVMGIIGLLISLLVPAANSAIVAVRVAATKNLISGICNGVEAFKVDWGVYPPSSNRLTPAPSDVQPNNGSGNLGRYLMGPSGNGWGDAGGAPFGGSAAGTWPPYYRGDSRYVTAAGFNDALQPPKVIFYYRAEPTLETTSVPLYDVNDCRAVGGTGLDQAAKASYYNQAQFELLTKRLKPGSSTDTEWVRRDYLIVSSGPDRYWGHVKVTVSGSTTTITPVSSRTDTDAMCDDIGNWSN